MREQGFLGPAHACASMCVCVSKPFAMGTVPVCAHSHALTHIHSIQALVPLSVCIQECAPDSAAEKACGEAVSRKRKEGANAENSDTGMEVCRELHKRDVTRLGTHKTLSVSGFTGKDS
jgi:hypothetical protein